MKGKLFVVATPIGNLEDITFRAVKVLNEVDLILCENEKNSHTLLHHYGIHTQLTNLRRLSKKEDYHWIFQLLDLGKNLAFISDAGTPGISDPGSNLVRVLRKKGYTIVPIPGASSLSAILSISGYQTNPTIFLGFLSPKKNQKEQELKKWALEEALLVIFESIHKLDTTLEMIQKFFPNSEVLIGRELTKFYEEIFIWKPTQEIPKFVKKGEFVILINNHLKKIAKEGRIFSDN